MRLVVQRYTADRALLGGNYQGGEGRGGGRGAGRGAGPQAPAARPSVSVSPNRIARLKRFDLDWQTAIGRIDAAKLSGPAKADLEALQVTIKNNLAALETDAAADRRDRAAHPLCPADHRALRVARAHGRRQRAEGRRGSHRDHERDRRTCGRASKPG